MNLERSIPLIIIIIISIIIIIIIIIIIGSVLRRDGYCAREIKIRFVVAKEAFNRKISLLTSKLNIELGNKIG